MLVRLANAQISPGFSPHSASNVRPAISFCWVAGIPRDCSIVCASEISGIDFQDFSGETVDICRVLGRPLPHFYDHVIGGQGKLSQFGSAHLGIATEYAEIRIYQIAVQEGGQTARF